MSIATSHEVIQLKSPGFKRVGDVLGKVCLSSPNSRSRRFRVNFVAKGHATRSLTV
jgi:hypothetical protein